MADLEQALDRLLADPEAMARIMDLAGKLNGPSREEDAPAEDTADVGTPPPPDVSSDPLSEPGRVAPLLSLLRGSGGADPRAEALLRALRPYLSADRRRRLDRAVRLSALVRGAKEAARMWKEGELSV